jgi:hypothetical protein
MMARAAGISHADILTACDRSVNLISVTLFLISPAKCGGERAQQLLHSERSELGKQLRAGNANIGDVFSWLSALYFRGKLTYANHFAGDGRVLIMTVGIGLTVPETRLTAAQFRAMGKLDVESPSYGALLRRHARRARDEHPGDRVVLLGSIATGKYTDVLLDVFGDRLLFPETFVGRGDMSRGGLLLRAVRSDEELVYVPVAGATLHGSRPAKLPPLPRRASAPTPNPTGGAVVRNDPSSASSGAVHDARR